MVVQVDIRIEDIVMAILKSTLCEILKQYNNEGIFWHSIRVVTLSVPRNYHFL